MNNKENQNMVTTKIRGTDFTYNKDTQHEKDGLVLCQEIVQDKKRKFYYPARTSFSLDWLVRYNFSNSLGDKYPQ